MRKLFLIILFSFGITTAFADENDTYLLKKCTLISDVFWQLEASKKSSAGFHDFFEESTKDGPVVINVNYVKDILTYSYDNGFPRIFKLFHRNESNTVLGTWEIIFKSHEDWSDATNQTTLRISDPFCEQREKKSQLVEHWASANVFYHRIFDCPCE